MLYLICINIQIPVLVYRKEDKMGKSLNGKELGKGITQRKDGLYQARFINRFGKRQTIYANTVTAITKKLRDEQYNDERQINEYSCGSKSRIRKFGNRSSGTRKSSFLCLITVPFLQEYLSRPCRICGAQQPLRIFLQKL